MVRALGTSKYWLAGGRGVRFGPSPKPLAAAQTSFAQLRARRRRLFPPCFRARCLVRCPSLQGLRAPAGIDSTSVGYSAVGTLPSSGNRSAAARPCVFAAAGRPNTAISLAADSATSRFRRFEEMAAATGAVPAPCLRCVDSVRTSFIFAVSTIATESALVSGMKARCRAGSSAMPSGFE